MAIPWSEPVRTAPSIQATACDVQPLPFTEANALVQRFTSFLYEMRSASVAHRLVFSYRAGGLLSLKQAEQTGFGTRVSVGDATQSRPASSHADAKHGAVMCR